MNRRTFLLAAGAGALAGRAFAARPRRRGLALERDVEAAVKRVFELDLAPGLGVAVYTRDGAYAGGFGAADISTGERAGARTAFYIASATKSMTALALAILHMRGRIDLDAALADYAPDAPFPAAVRPTDIRLRQLLSHTGGIENEPIEYRFSDTGQHDPDTLWRLLGVCRPNNAAPPGRFQYANIGYNITTILTDRRIGVRWQDLLHTEIFARAGMTRTSAGMSRARTAGWSVARPHVLGPAGRRMRSYLEKTDRTMHSAGGVIMSAEDAARWLELMIEDGRIGGRQLIPAEIVQATRSPIADVHVEFNGYNREHYGLGWYIGPYRGERMLHHFGGYTGYRAHISYVPERAVGVAAFVNESTVGLATANAVANYIYDRTGGHDDADERLGEALASAAARREAAIRRTAEEEGKRARLAWSLTRPRQAYAGVYENEQWGSIGISADNETLEVTHGVLHAVAGPSATGDSLWAELVPGQGGEIRFEGDGKLPDALYYEGERFQRSG